MGMEDEILDEQEEQEEQEEKEEKGNEEEWKTKMENSLQTLTEKVSQLLDRPQPTQEEVVEVPVPPVPQPAEQEQEEPQELEEVKEQPKRVKSLLKWLL